MANEENRQDPGEKAASSPQLWGTPNPKTTGVPGGVGQAGGLNPGEVQGTANVFGTSVTNGTGAPGSASGQSEGDSKSVTHTAYSADKNTYDTVTVSTGVSPAYKPLVGEYFIDNGVGEGHLLIGGRKPNHRS